MDKYFIVKIITMKFTNKSGPIIREEKEKEKENNDLPFHFKYQITMIKPDTGIGNNAFLLHSI